MNRNSQEDVQQMQSFMNPISITVNERQKEIQRRRNVTNNSVSSLSGDDDDIRVMAPKRLVFTK